MDRSLENVVTNEEIAHAGTNFSFVKMFFNVVYCSRRNLEESSPHRYKLKSLNIPDDNGKVILEYFTLNYTRLDMLSRTYIVDFEPQSAKECPVRCAHDFDSEEAKHPAPELAWVPVAIYRDPFRQGKHKLILCELKYADGRDTDLQINTRKKCKEVLAKVKDKEPWFGIEQEFYITDKKNVPLDWSIFKPSIDHANEMNMGDHTGFERQFIDLHLRACLYAGLEMYGCDKEMNPSQWEFQVGPLPGIQTADQVIVARYLLVRLAEMHGLRISFRNIDSVRHTNARQTFHLNFSTKSTRAEGGINALKDIIENVSRYPQEELYKHYDLSNGEEMKWYLSGDFYMPDYHTFKVTVGDKDKASIRIPTQVSIEGKGYLEERRPVPNADPYNVCRAFTIAALYDHGGNIVQQ